MNQIIKDNNNLITDTNGNIIKSIPFNESTISTGKVAEYLNGNWQNTGGYLQTWYNSIGTNHFLQNSVGYRPIIEYAAKNISIKNEIVLNYMTTTSTLTFQTMMFAYQFNASVRFLYYSATHLIGGISVNVPFPLFMLDGITPLIKMNDILYTINTTKTYGFYVVVASFSRPVSFTTLNRLNNSQSNTTETDTFSKYLEFVFYNRILNDSEITYNTNVLRTKFNF